MKKLQVQNRKDEYIARSQVGTIVIEKRIVSSSNRNDFEVRTDGYFVWGRVRKNVK